MASNEKSFTFRVRRVPAYVTESSIATFLSDSVNDLRAKDNIRVRSLAPSPDDWNLPAKQTATIEFLKLPTCFQTEQDKTYVFSIKDTNQTLLFDRAFLGFTPLNKAIDHNFNCIAVSGLASHAFGSWRERNATARQFIWLRDQLPEDFPHMRVLLYGYDTALFGSQSLQETDDLARSFIAHLKAIGMAELRAKPMILMAHSLGGILVKRALTYLAASGEAESFLLSEIKLLICFGVPNRGMYIQHLLAMTDSQPNQPLVDALSKNSEYLQSLEKTFSGISAHRRIRLVSAYETVKSQIAVHTPEGKWERSGQFEYLVTRASAIQSGSRDPEDIFHIDRDHSDMVKFSPDEIAYFVVRNFVHETMVSTLGPSESHQSVSQASAEVLDLSTQASNNQIGTSSSGLVVDIPGINSPETCSASKTSIGDPLKIDIEAAKIQKREALRNILDFQERTFRLHVIERAQNSTLEWVFDKKELGFLDWVFGTQGLFWIRGKPGSGKSTLMRHQHDNHGFRQALKSRNLARVQIDLWFFFNDRGSYLQKSLSGLLRSILIQLMDQEERISDLALAIRESHSHMPNDEWSDHELHQAFRAVMHQDLVDLDVILFLDALDEYQGFPEEIARWINNLTSKMDSTSARTRIKICFSSRQWDAFVEVFDLSPGFTLHQYTMRDIKHYTHVRLLQARPRLTFVDQVAVVGAIARRAEGVFLWVKLAVNEIFNLSGTNTLEDVEMLIQSLPDELESFYAKTILRIPLHKRYKAFIMLEAMYRSSELLSPEDLYRIMECAQGATYPECREYFELACRKLSYGAYEVNEDLLNLCGGLLELKVCTDPPSADDSTDEPADRLQFVHRTVRDFIGRPGFTQLILQDQFLVSIENGYTFLFKHELCMDFRSQPRTADGDILLLANLDERTTGRPLTDFIDSIPFISLTHIDPDYEDVDDCTSPFVFATMAGLRLYLQHTLSRPGQYPPARKFASQKPLWRLINRMISNKYFYFESSPQEFTITDTLKLLLENGFRADDGSPGSNAFPTLFQYPYASAPTTEIIEAARLLIVLGGQNPNAIFPAWNHRGAAGAVHYSSDRFLKMLLENGADPNLLDSNGYTALDYRITQSHTEARSCELCDLPLLLAHHGTLTNDGLQHLSGFLQQFDSQFPVEIVDALFELEPLVAKNHPPSSTAEQSPPIPPPAILPGRPDTKKIRLQESMSEKLLRPYTAPPVLAPVTVMVGSVLHPTNTGTGTGTNSSGAVQGLKRIKR